MKISGYTLIAPLCDACDLRLYQATQARDDRPVLLKVPVLPSNPAVLRRLEHEYQIARDLDPSRVVHPLALERHNGTLALVMQQGPTTTLASLLGSPMDVQPFLRIALGINAALAELHRHELVHKDIKPEHVLMDASGHIWLTGLGIASRLPKERQAPDPPDLIAGTLAYMAPEQTGRMNRSIDSRSDLYALGVTFYQMLTGVFPFTAGDPMEWVHCHIARQPIPPSQRVPQLPELLSDLVMKLLAKTAEERYQSATGLDSDLRRCLVEWEANGRIDPFPLGTHDVPDRLLIPEKLYGREAEIQCLLAAFGRVVARGTPELMLVSGYSGIGKSSVVNELHKVLVPPRGLFASGKFDQYKRDIPYATLAQALQTLVRQVLGKPEEEVSQWRQAMQEAVGTNGQILVSLIPELGVVIGPQPPVPELSPQDAQNRFNTVFRRFLGVFARKEHPLALFLDDLQWLDAATLELLKHLLSHPDVKYLFLLGAYRDNEVSPTHPLMLALDAIRQSGARVHEIVLAPLTENDVGRLVAETVRCEVPHAGPLAQLVHEKTGGNPFFAIQFVIALADEGLITFDDRSKEWRWDIDRIRAKGFTDNVADLMIGKLSRLPVPALNAVKGLACLGNRAESATLAMVLEIPEEQLHADLWEAIRAGLVQYLAGSYAFLHDRILEAAYALVPLESRPAMHLQAGQRMLSRMDPSKLQENLFDVLNQLNRGRELLTSAAEQQDLARLNIAAGKKARASVAHMPARNFFAIAASLLPEEWQAWHDVKFPLFLDWAECEYLCGAFEQAESLFHVLLEQAHNEFDRARVYELRLKVYHVAGKYDTAVAMGLKALQLFGVEIPENEQALQEATQAEAAVVKVNLGGRKIADLADAPAATDPSVRAIIGLLSNVAPAAYIGSRPEIFPIIILKLVNTALKFGHTHEACMGYSAYGFLLVSLYDDPHTAFAFSEMSIRLNQKLGDISRRGTVLHLHGDHINFWLHHISTDFPILERGFVACLDAGDLVFANFIAYEIVWQAVERGDALGEVLKFSGKYADFSRGCRNDAVHQSICLEQQFLKCLMGKTKSPSSFDEDTFQEVPCVEKIADATFTCGIVFYHTMKLFAAYLFRDEPASLVHAEKAQKTLAAAMAMPMEATFHFLHALVLARTYQSASEQQRPEILTALRQHERKLALWAKNCPENFASKHALASAEIAFITRDELAAERLYEQAIHSARANGFIHWEAMANEAAGYFYRERGFGNISTMYLRQARDCYLRWGATAKVQHLDTQFPHLEERPSLATSTTTFGAEVTALDVLAVVAASQAISREILLHNLLETLMRIVLENAGAQRGHLLLMRQDRLTLAAEARVEKENMVMEVHRDPELPQGLLPASLVNYVRRSGDRVLLDDAAAPHPYSGDRYFSRRHPKSVLCFPITKQTKLIGLFYLENDLATHAFTLERLAVLELLAAQAAIALENALVYEALKESESKYRRIIDTANEGVWILGPDTLTTGVNSRMAQMLGYSPEEMSGRTLPDFMFEEDVPDHLARMEHRRHGESEYYERRFRHKGGETVWTLASATPVFDNEHRFLGSFAMFTDITELKSAVEEIHRLNQELEKRVWERTLELEAANRELESFSYSVSHDLRAPLRAIIGFSRRVLKDNAAQLDEEGRENLVRVCDTSKRMDQLIEGMLQLSRLSRSEIHRSRVNLSELANSLATELRKVEPERQVEFVIEPDLIAEADAVLMRSVLENVIGNAWKFTSKQASAKIEFGRFSKEQPPAFFVRDNGAGFDMQYAGKLFGVFERLHSMREFPGSGIGLANVQRIIQKHGGRIWAEAEPGKGATFYFTLPEATPTL